MSASPGPGMMSGIPPDCKGEPRENGEGGIGESSLGIVHFGAKFQGSFGKGLLKHVVTLFPILKFGIL